MNVLINALLVLLPFLLMEGVFRLLPVSNLPYLLPVSAEHPVPRFQANADYLYSRDWNFSVKTRKRSNNFGYINASDYRIDRAAPLLAVIGDSFVEAQQVASGKSAAEILDTSVAGRGRVYSIGLSGAPLSQYLVFAEFARSTFRPDAMAFFIIGNDYDESLLKYKSDHRFHYFDDHGKLQRIDYHIPTSKRILRQSALVRYVVLNLEAGHKVDAIRKLLRGVDDSRAYVGAAGEQRILDSNRAVDYFLDQLPARSGLDSGSIVLVLDAVRPEIYSAEALLAADNSYHSRMRRYLEKQARARGYEVLDMQPVFIRKHRLDNSRFEAAATDSHWNEPGHRLVAEEIQKSAAFARVFQNRDPMIRTGNQRLTPRYSS